MNRPAACWIALSALVLFLVASASPGAAQRAVREQETVAGHVTFDRALPEDESVEAVLAIEVERDPRDHPMHRAFKEIARAPVNADGHFRLPKPPGGVAHEIAFEGDYVVRSPYRWEDDEIRDPARVLEATVGAHVTFRLQGTELEDWPVGRQIPWEWMYDENEPSSGPGGRVRSAHQELSEVTARGQAVSRGMRPGTYEDKLGWNQEYPLGTSFRAEGLHPSRSVVPFHVPPGFTFKCLAGVRSVVDVPLLRGASLHGRVLSPSGEPVKDATLAWDKGAEGPPWIRETRTNPKGEFRFDVLPRSLSSIELSHPDHPTRVLGQGESRALLERSGIVDLRFDQWSDLAVHVQLPDGRDAFNAKVELVPLDQPWPSATRQTETSDLEGVARFPRLSAGRYGLRCDGWLLYDADLEAYRLAEDEFLSFRRFGQSEAVSDQPERWASTGGCSIEAVPGTQEQTLVIRRVEAPSAPPVPRLTGWVIFDHELPPSDAPEVVLRVRTEPISETNPWPGSFEEVARAPLGSDRRFDFPRPTGALAVELAVVGDHVVPRGKRWELGELPAGEVELHAEVGAHLTFRLTSPDWDPWLIGRDLCWELTVDPGSWDEGVGSGPVGIPLHLHREFVPIEAGRTAVGRGMRPGTYVLVSSPDQQFPPGSKYRAFQRPSIAPYGVPEALTIECAPGERRVIDVPLERGVPLGGRVLSSDGEPVDGARLTWFFAGVPANDESAGRSHFTETNKEGQYKFDALARGLERLEVQHPDHPDLLIAGESARKLLKGGEGVDIRFEPWGTLRVHVQVPDGRDAFDARVRLAKLGDDEDWGWVREATTDLDGMAVFERLLPGRYVLAASGWLLYEADLETHRSGEDQFLGFRRGRERPSLGMPMSPDAERWTTASPPVIDVDHGPMNADVTLQRGARYELRVDADVAATAEEFRVRLRRPRDTGDPSGLESFFAAALTEEPHTYLAGLAPGPWIAEVVRTTRRYPKVVATLRFEASGAPGSLTLEAAAAKPKPSKERGR